MTHSHSGEYTKIAIRHQDNDDGQGYSPRKLYSYYSKESLQYLIRQRTERKNLNATAINTQIAGRDYQIETITRICERFSQNHRKALDRKSVV